MAFKRRTPNRENKPYLNVFQDVHRKIQDKKDELRKASEARTGMRREDAVKEAVEKGFDRPATESIV
jgi:hypothetical protein